MHTLYIHTLYVCIYIKSLYILNQTIFLFGLLSNSFDSAVADHSKESVHSINLEFKSNLD